MERIKDEHNKKEELYKIKLINKEELTKRDGRVSMRK